MSILAQAIQRWEAESGAMRSLSGLPYDLDTYVAGFVLGYRKEPCPPGMHLDSFRVGHRSGEADRRIADREIESDPVCQNCGGDPT